MHPRRRRYSSLKYASILSRRALPPGRLARLGATLDLHRGLLGVDRAAAGEQGRSAESQRRYQGGAE